VCEPRCWRQYRELEDCLLDCRFVDLPQETFSTDILSAGISIGVGLIRICFPESKQFLEAKKAGKASSDPKAFWRDTKQMLAKEWKMCIYAIILMTWVSLDPLRK
jgi:hypothetical protein